MSSTLKTWNTLADKPMGKWLFSKGVCTQAPFFASINPIFDELRPAYSKVHIRKRRQVLNHIGTVHAIAMCNMAELSGGTMTDVTVPSTHRWIPKGMTVKYLKKADTDLIAVATPIENEIEWLQSSFNYPVKVEVSNTRNEVVFEAIIDMWISPKK